MNQPLAAMLCLLLVGFCMAAAGVFLLAGAGWALIFGAVPFVGLALVMGRGLNRAE